MDAYLFIDTETTGFKKAGPLIQPGQARVCQLAMLLTDGHGQTMAQFSALIKPNDWSIQDGAKAIHGHSNEDCERFGVVYGSAFLFYKRFCEKADLVVAHNVAFDKGMMEIEQAVYNYHAPGIDNIPPLPTVEVNNKWFCTMDTNKHLNGGKWPKLGVTLKYYCDREQTKAHDAMGDVIDCRDIFFSMKAKNLI